MEVFNTLLQVLDDGRLTDSQGRTIDFSNTVIIMTSNLGSHHLLAHMTEEAWIHTEEKVKESAMAHFPPEFINRLDGLLVFRPLDGGIMKQIVDLNIAEICARVRKLKDIDLCPSHRVVELVTNEMTDRGFTFGARPVKRYLEHNIVTPLSKSIVAGRICKESDDMGDKSTVKVLVDVADGKLVFRDKDGVDLSVSPSEHELESNKRSRTSALDLDLDSSMVED